MTDPIPSEIRCEPLSEHVRIKVMLFLQGVYENKRMNDGIREIAKNLQIEMQPIPPASPAHLFCPYCDKEVRKVRQGKTNG